MSTNRVGDRLEGSWRYTGKTHERTRCVHVDYADQFHIDVVHYIESTSNIIDNKTDDREYTDPQGFTAWLEGTDRIVGGGRLPAVLRLLKYLRDGERTFSVTSVLLTILVGERVEAWSTTAGEEYYADSPTALVHLLEDLDTYLQANYWMPAIHDPAGTEQ